MLRAGRSVWAALKPNGSAVRLGITADAVAEVGLTRDKAFADLAALESIMLPQRPFAMVEGPLGVAQLESPLAGLVAARNLSVIDDPGVLFDRAECVVDGWLARSHGVVVELDVDDDAAAVRDELAGLADFPERAPRLR